MESSEAAIALFTLPNNVTYMHSAFITCNTVLDGYINFSGLNCYSMLKHETLVLTLAAVEKIEEKLLFQMNRPDCWEPRFNRNDALAYSQPHIPR